MLNGSALMVTPPVRCKYTCILAIKSLRELHSQASYWDTEHVWNSHWLTVL